MKINKKIARNKNWKFRQKMSDKNGPWYSICIFHSVRKCKDGFMLLLMPRPSLFFRRWWYRCQGWSENLLSAVRCRTWLCFCPHRQTIASHNRRDAANLRLLSNRISDTRHIPGTIYRSTRHQIPVKSRTGCRTYSVLRVSLSWEDLRCRGGALSPERGDFSLLISSLFMFMFWWTRLHWCLIIWIFVHL